MKTAIIPTAEQQRRLQVLANWDFSMVRAFAIRDGVLEADVDEMIEEYRKFLALHIFTERQNFTMSRQIDIIWHSSILCTRDYARLCKSVLGAFLHHQPVGTQAELDDLAPAYNEGTRPALRRVFGELNERWWGTDQQICHDPSQSCPMDLIKASEREIAEEYR